MALLLRRRNRPVWFLDIDGVLAPLGRRQWGVEYQGINVGGYHGNVLVVPSALARVAALHRAEVVEVRWLSSWDDDAATVFAPRVGLDRYRVYREPAVEGPVWWKEQVVRDFCGRTRRRFVWTDDEMEVHGSAGPVTGEYPDRGLVVAVDGLVGLTHEMVNRIEDWVTAR